MNVLSGVLVAALGVALFVGNPRKDWNRVFALFCGFWGVQIVFLNLVASAGEAGTAFLLGRVGFAFLLPVYFFLAYFAAVFPRPRGVLSRSAAAVFAAAMPAGAAVVVLVTRPELLVRGATELPDGTYTMTWGPLTPWLGLLPLYAALVYALFTMMRRLDEAESDIERNQIAFVLAALGAFAAYSVPVYAFLFGRTALGLDGATEAGKREAALFAWIMAGATAFLAVLAARLFRRARPVFVALATAAAGAAAVSAVFAATGVFVDLLGLVRLASIALIVYAIARYQLFDLDLRVKQGAAVATAGVAGASVGAAAWVVLREARVSDALGGTLTVVAAVAAFLPMLRVSWRLADRLAPSVSREGDHLYLRKLEVYRASVEAALGEGRGISPQDPRLSDLRSKLGLAERDHDVAASLVRPRESAAPDLRPGGVVFGKYVVDSLLGEGGFGRVFLARDRLIGRAVVVKELQARWRGSPSLAHALLREARIGGSIDSPHVVRVHEVERHGEDYFVVMEHCPGGSLGERLGAGGRLPQAEAVRVARGVLEALAAAHARGVVHRDVKPGNVLFGAKDEPKLGDFGIAHFEEAEPERTVSGLGPVAPLTGTLAYASPEQARGGRVDARSDVYAVGALLYRMLAGRPPVDLAGLDELAARQKVAAAEPPADVPGAGAALAAAVRRALARAPEERYASARDFLDALPP